LRGGDFKVGLQRGHPPYLGFDFGFRMEERAIDSHYEIVALSILQPECRIVVVNKR